MQAKSGLLLRRRSLIQVRLKDGHAHLARVDADQGRHHAIAQEYLDLDMRRTAIFLAFVLTFIGSTWSQAATVVNPEDVQEGHILAIRICGNCHVAAPDQVAEPIMKPPAPSFASIVQHKNFDAGSLTQFLTTTHRGLDNPQGMPNPDFMDYQIKQVVAYFLSLYK